jgi:hypothetical protein
MDGLTTLLESTAVQTQLGGSGRASAANRVHMGDGPIGQGEGQGGDRQSSGSTSASVESGGIFGTRRQAGACGGSNSPDDEAFHALHRRETVPFAEEGGQMGKCPGCGRAASPSMLTKCDNCGDVRCTASNTGGCKGTMGGHPSGAAAGNPCGACGKGHYRRIG